MSKYRLSPNLRKCTIIKSRDEKGVRTVVK